MTEQVLVRFSDPRLLNRYMSKLRADGVSNEMYKQSKRNPSVLTIKTESIEELENLIKQIDHNAKVFKNTIFKTF